MKFKFCYYLFVLFLASALDILPQEPVPPLEIFTLTNGFGQYDVTRFRMDPLSEVYCTDSYSNYFHVPSERNTITLARGLQAIIAVEIMDFKYALMMILDIKNFG